MKMKQLDKIPSAKRGLTTFEVSRLCGVFPSTVIYWVKKGKLDCYTTPGGHRRILGKVLLPFMEKYNFPGLIEAKQYLKKAGHI